MNEKTRFRWQIGCAEARFLFASIFAHIDLFLDDPGVIVAGFFGDFGVLGMVDIEQHALIARSVVTAQ